MPLQKLGGLPGYQNTSGIPEITRDSHLGNGNFNRNAFHSRLRDFGLPEFHFTALLAATWGIGVIEGSLMPLLSDKFIFGVFGICFYQSQHADMLRLWRL